MGGTKLRNAMGEPNPATLVDLTAATKIFLMEAEDALRRYPRIFAEFSLVAVMEEGSLAIARVTPPGMRIKPKQFENLIR